MARRFVTRILILWVCLGLAGEAAACTPARHARLETNLELVARAPTILIGRVVRWDRKKVPENQYYEESSILVEPVEILKGEGPQAPFRLDDMLAMTEGLASPADSQPSAYDEFREPHVNAYMGGCIRYNFVIGQLVVFLLATEKGMWVPSASIFSRWAEDVPSVDGPWVKLVRIYVQASQLPKGQRRKFLRAERDKLLAGDLGRIERLMADDIDRQIKRRP
ncbi:hypothetical protein NSE01_22760 [Novosphingobium sediminis]|uniref:Lipoprotein n=1 Tax=Novosphingobium sediminis TaxID=707214 RepID=A0A512AL96_9SPHN|nr:hypothetical protein [Novosphingobium sediminis]GEO00444.1 hypothetical protein NSE01_22760 [Novosphingobium sediminis]